MTRPDPAGLSGDTIVAFIADIFARRGAESYLGEQVTMSQHMLQAAFLAQEAGAGEDLIVAALLHDIGHFTNEFPDDALSKGVDNRHDAAGAAVLSAFFPATVTACVRHHVAAKRYLCATDAAYLDALSPASVHTLSLQGGPMSAAEQRDFAAIPGLEAILQVRRWDDLGKDANRATPSFEHFAPLLQRAVERHRRGA